MSKIHLEIFDEERIKIFKSLSQFSRLGYLAGGTALALQIHHRKSFDFDVFLTKPVNNRLRLKIKKVFGNVTVNLNTEDQLNLITETGANITFLWYYFKLLNPPIRTESINLASVQDIVADKAYTIGRRALWRDYVDLYFILKNKAATIKSIISLALKKFKGNFNESLFLEQLVYFQDLEETPIEFISEKPTSSEIKSSLEEEVKQYLKKL